MIDDALLRVEGGTEGISISVKESLMDLTEPAHGHICLIRHHEFRLYHLVTSNFFTTKLGFLLAGGSGST